MRSIFSWRRKALATRCMQILPSSRANMHQKVRWLTICRLSSSPCNWVRHGVICGCVCVCVWGGGVCVLVAAALMTSALTSFCTSSCVTIRQTIIAAGPTVHQDRLFQAFFPIFNTVCLELAATNCSEQRLSLFFF